MQNSTNLPIQECFPFGISSVNVTKSAVSAVLVTFTEEIIIGKLHFIFCAVK